MPRTFSSIGHFERNSRCCLCETRRQKLNRKRSTVNGTNNGAILVTGAAGKTGAVGRTVTGLLLERGLPVRAMVRTEDDRARALRAAGAEVVVGDLLEPSDVYRVVSGCRRVFFGMSVAR